MLYNILLFIFSLSFLPAHLVSSNPTEPLGKRLASNAVNEIDGLFLGQVNDTTYKSVFSVLNKLKPTATINSIAQATAAANGAFVPSPSNLFDVAAILIESGITPGNLTELLEILVSGCNSQKNSNPAPPQAIYPKKGSSDAPYSIKEAQLRAAIDIPSSFTHGKKPPVILVPGTGDTGCFTFDGNFIPLLTGQSYADPVWLNIPDYLLDDIQFNAEYVAYAINYISAISNNANVSVIAWSQGNIDTQWALKYWPSTRNVTSDLISISPDFHGTITAYLSCPGIPSTSCTPAVIQQEYNSNLINTLRSNGGDSAYVPTTTIYSASDEIVQPQSGTNASAIMNDARNVGVSNTQVQLACPGLPAGGPYTHEGMLYNPLSFALAVDALTHPGPGSLSRINLASICSQSVTAGLTAQDVVLTEETIVVAAVAIALYEPKVVTEPPIQPYAAS